MTLPIHYPLRGLKQLSKRFGEVQSETNVQEIASKSSQVLPKVKKK